MDIEKYLTENGFVKINRSEDFYINKKAEILKIFTNKQKKRFLKPISTSKTANGNLKVNFMIDKKNTSNLLYLLVYEAFNKNLNDNDTICFIDGDKFNCKYDNLVSLSDLLDFYNKNKRKG